MSVPYYGDYPAGATVYIPFNTFTSDDPSASVTMTNFVNTDVHIHKNLGLTQRNNAAGVTVDVDVDGLAGCHGITIDTSDNTVADFWVSGADYQVRIEGVTVDAATLNPFVGSFSLENRMCAGYLVATTIATLASQTSFTLTAGSADNDAYNNCLAIVTDIASAVQKCIGRISDYTGASKTVTLAADPGIFTMAAKDRITIVASSALANVSSIGGTAQTANDNGADINDILTDTGTTLQGELDAIEAAVITNAAGTDIAADIIAVKAETATIVNDTDLIDDGTSGLAKIASDVADILVDTGSTLDTLIKDIPTVAEFEARSDLAGTAATPAEAETACDNAFATYDPPTRAELTTDKNSIITEIDANETKIDTVDTVVDGIQTDLSNATDGLGALKALIDALQTQVDTTGVALLASAVDAIWDEVLTAAAHNVATSAGRKIRELTESLIIDQDTAQAGAATTITLAVGASAVNDFYKGMIVVLLSSTGSGQARACTGYDGGTKVVTIGPAWATNPASGTEYAILSFGSVVVAAIDDIDLSPTMKTSVNAEAVDALNVDTYAEPGQEAPPATTTLVKKIGYLFKFLRNKIDNDGSTIQVYADDGSTVDQKSTVNESGGTVTRGEFGSGP
jgi:hypothetical protein